MKTRFLTTISLFFNSMLFAQTTEHLMNFGGVQRDFYVHLPTGFSNSKHLPLVFNLHGLGSNAQQEEFYSLMSGVADSQNFIVVYPDGIANQWNVGFTGAYDSGTDDVGFISAIIDTIYKQYAIDTTRVYSCGMSDGGFMTYRLACELENRFAAFAAVSGTLTDSVAFHCTHTRNIPIMHVHGTADPLVSYVGDADTGYYGAEPTVSFWLNKNGCLDISDTTFIANTDTADSSTVQKIHYGQCGSGTQVLFYKIIGGGHSWPGAPIDYIYGPTNHDISGSVEIWNFFKQYTLAGPTAINPATAEEIELRVYPNPFISQLKIESEQIIQKVQILNVLGEEVFRQSVHSNDFEIQLPGIANGIYFLKLSGTSFEKSIRIVRQN